MTNLWSHYDRYKTCQVRSECQVDGKPLDIPERAGEFAAILGRIGPCFTLRFIDGEVEGQVHVNNLESFVL